MPDNNSAVALVAAAAIGSRLPAEKRLAPLALAWILPPPIGILPMLVAVQQAKADAAAAPPAPDILPALVNVPSVVGNEQKAAQKTLSDARLQSAIERRFSGSDEKGLVIQQKPQSGEKVEEGWRVMLTVGAGERPPDVVPESPAAETNRLLTGIREDLSDVRTKVDKLANAAATAVATGAVMAAATGPATAADAAPTGAKAKTPPATP
ncbi:MAG: PASTA domain-containing protein [Alphaproteobacteria bacterium]|nr:PASTA domain-containing protein [Alphaproteobacteria bacterium]